jgi:zinc protease
MKLAAALLLGVYASAAAALPEIKHWQTPNGAKVYFVHAPELPMVNIGVIFDAAGARDGELPGLAAMTNGMLAEGAGGLSSEQISEGFEQVGAEFGNSSLRDMATLSLRSLTDPKQLKPALELFSTVMSKPDFPQAAFERERKRSLAGLEYQKQSPGDLASKAFYKALYGTHPYAQPVEGTEESLNALTVEALRKFYQKYYVAGNAVIAMVGDLDQAAAAQVAEQITRQLPQGQAAPRPPKVEELKAAQTVHIEHPSAQTHVYLGQPGMSRYDPDYFPLYVGNHIFGGGGLVSRLSEEVREKRGLSYSVSSGFTPMREAGPFTAALQTRTDQTEQALQVMREEITKFIESGPTEAELKSAKQNLTGGFALEIDSNKDIVNYLAMIGFYGLPLDYLNTWMGKVEAVTAAQIQDAFKRRIHPDKMVLITAGKAVESKNGGKE